MDYLQQLLGKYWAGTISEGQRQELLDLLEKQAGEIQSFQENIFNAAGSGNELLLSDSRSRAVLHSLHEKIAEEAPVRPRIGIAARITRIAAVAAAITGIILFVSSLAPDRKTSKTAPVEDPASIVQSPAAMADKSISNKGHKRRPIVLEDGSLVVLYPGAVLHYRPPSDREGRSFTLEGQAVFTVVKDAARPFKVYSGRVTTTVLGTKFMINTHASSDHTQVRLLEGKIMVHSAAAKDVYLSPGQEYLSHNIDGQVLVRKFGTTPADHMVAAAGGRSADPNALEFTRMSLADVFIKVGRHYNVSIRCGDASVNRLTFTGRFLPTDSLEVILNVICNTNDLLFQQEDNLVLVRKMN